MNLNCPHFDECAGCSLAIDIEKPFLYEDACRFFLKQGIAHLKLHVGHLWEWRSRAKLVVRGSVSKPIVGLFQKGSHWALDIPFCRVHHPSINEGANILRQWITDVRVEPYDEASGLGLLRYVQFTVERKTGRVQLVLVLNSHDENDPSYIDLKQKIERLWQKGFHLWHSLWINFNTRRDNVIVGGQWKLVQGELWLWEKFLGRDVCFHPASFIQSNLDMFEELLASMINKIPENSHLIEFYAGVGAITLAMIERCLSVHCVEIVPQAKSCFDESIKHLSSELAKRLSFTSGVAASYTHLIDQKVDIVIVDPPRKGLEKPLLNDLCSNSVLKKLIYISCGWESFQSDCLTLTSSGWKLIDGEAFLFFPGSDHLEILAIFERGLP